MSQLSLFNEHDDHPKFDGETIEPEDQPRLESALARVYELMSDGHWRSIAEIAERVGCTENGASARLRDLRKAKFKSIYPNGGVERKRVRGGLFSYRMKGI